MELLTTEQANQLSAVRRLLLELEESAKDASRGVEGVTPADFSTTRNLGRLSEALDIAGDMVFNILNTCSSYLSDPEAERAIKAWNDE